MKRDEANQLWYRGGVMDRFIIDEVRAVYAAMPIQAGDIALDLGAHIGAASRLMLEMGAAKVIAVEPDPGSLKVLIRNLAGYPSQVVAAAVGPVTDGDTELSIRADRPFLTTTFGSEPGRTMVRVPTVTLGELLDSHQPTVIKCDIEFGEYGLPELWALPDYVRVLAMEVHIRPDLVLHTATPTADEVGTHRAAASVLMSAIEDQGFEVVVRKEKQAVKPPAVHDKTGLQPMTKSVDVTWVRA